MILNRFDIEHVLPTFQTFCYELDIKQNIFINFFKSESKKKHAKLHTPIDTY